MSQALRTSDNFHSIMAQEVHEIPQRAQNCLLDNAPLIKEIAAKFAQKTFSYVVICGRGSSSHAGVHLRYLIETILGYGVSNAAPSVITGYRTTPRMKDALYIVISQSGRSPDIVAATEAAAKGGALTLAIVNDASSPVAKASHFVVPILAGEEKAVAATKTVVNSMLVGASLVANIAEDDLLRKALGRLPERLQQALACDWSAWTASLKQAPATFVTGRGHGYGAAREVALKMSETLQLPSLAFSSAELKHGPRAAVHSSTPVLALRQNDALAQSTDSLISELIAAGIPAFQCGGEQGNLPFLKDDHPALDPIAMLLPAYLAIEAEARRRGLNPDKPVGLNKVTETL